MPITKLHRWQIEYTNEREYHLLKQEVFGRDHYFFETEKAQPKIIDAGAHIGLSTLYFLTHYPGAQIIALEPNPHVAAMLERNIWLNQVENQVDIQKVALGPVAGRTDLYLDSSEDQWWSTSSIHPGAWSGDQTTYAVTVPVVPLSSFLSQPVDLIKLDIEGAEQAVLMEAGTALTKVDQLIVEFHPHPTQSLMALTRFLIQMGFEVSIWKKGKTVTVAQAGNALVLIKAKQTYQK